MTNLFYIPIEEFRRLRLAQAPPEVAARAFADMCRINALYMITRTGSGHIGSSFSAMDIVSWLYLNEVDDGVCQGSVYFSSKGHDAPGLYSILIALEKLDFSMLHELRELNGLPGHPDIETSHIATNTGSLGMGISKAKGMLESNGPADNEIERVFVLLGDGELQEGQLWESLPGAVNRRLDRLTAIVDHNKIQSDTWVEKVSSLGDLENKFRSFGWHVQRCEGHSFDQIRKSLDTAKKFRGKPQIIIADTVKGAGVSFMEHTAMAPDQTLYRFHSGAPGSGDYERAVSELVEKVNQQFERLGMEPLTLVTIETSGPSRLKSEQRLIPAYSEALTDQAENNPNIIALDADLILDTGLIPFQERFPDRFVECGIAEQDMVSQAGGMALMGLLPVVHSFACFLTARPNEQIYNNASERRKAIYVGSLAGLLPAGPGHSHQSVRDISLLGSIPGLVMVEPSCEAEVAPLVDYCFNRTGESAYIRLVSIPCDIPYQFSVDGELEEGRGTTLIDGDDAIVFSYGPVMLSESYKASIMLREKQGLKIRIVNLPWLNRLDPDWLLDISAAYRNVFTIDNHYVRGGQGEMIAAALASNGSNRERRVYQFGLSDFPKCGQNSDVLRSHGLDARSLADRMYAMIAGET